VSVGVPPRGGFDNDLGHSQHPMITSAQNSDLGSVSDDSYDYDIDLSEESKGQTQEPKNQNPISTNVEQISSSHQKEDQVQNQTPGADTQEVENKEMTTSSVMTSALKPAEQAIPPQPKTFSELISLTNPAIPDTDDVCLLCEKTGATVRCVLECQRQFHSVCLEQMPTKKVVNDQEII